MPQGDLAEAFKHTEREIRLAVAAGDRAAAQQFLDAQRERVRRMSDGGDLDGLTAWAACAERLRVNIPGTSQLAVGVRETIAALLDAADRRVSALSQREDVRARDRQADLDRDLVSGYLRDHPLATRVEITSALGLSDLAVARALSEIATG